MASWSSSLKNCHGPRCGASLDVSDKTYPSPLQCQPHRQRQTAIKMLEKESGSSADIANGHGSGGDDQDAAYTRSIDNLLYEKSAVGENTYDSLPPRVEVQESTYDSLQPQMRAKAEESNYDVPRYIYRVCWL